MPAPSAPPPPIISPTAPSTASRLPGFLRRSLRIRYDEEEEEEEEEEEGEGEGEEAEEGEQGERVAGNQDERGRTSEPPGAEEGPSSSPPPPPAAGSGGGRRRSGGGGAAAAVSLATTAPSEAAPAARAPEDAAPPASAAAAESGGGGGPGRLRLISAALAKDGDGPPPRRPLPPPAPPVDRGSGAGGDGAGGAAGAEEPPPPPPPPPARRTWREAQFERCLGAEVVSLAELRRLSWNGIPPPHRAAAWKLLLGYAPTNRQRREAALARKRREYKETVAAQHYHDQDADRTPQDQETLRQVLVDVPRTAPDVPLFRHDRIKRLLARLLYSWAMRHPASSYVQGINDLATPLVVVFLGSYFEGGGHAQVLDGHVMNHLPDSCLDEVEADAYWCLSSLLSSIQDHYTADQPGVQRMVRRLEDLARRIDPALCRHLRSEGVEFLQFSFKWMNCLLLREFRLGSVPRLWDTYIAERSGFEDFHVYVCAAFLCQFSAELQTMPFDALFGFFQQMPTASWSDGEVEMLLSQAYVLSTLFGGSDAHLANTGGAGGRETRAESGDGFDH